MLSSHQFCANCELWFHSLLFVGSRTYGYNMSNLHRRPFYNVQEGYWTKGDGPYKTRTTLSVELAVTMEHMFLGSILMTVVFLVVTWYVEAVFPGEYGVAEKPWFFLTVSNFGFSKIKQYESDLTSLFKQPSSKASICQF